MHTAILSPSFTTLRSPSNLLCRKSGQHPDGLRRASQRRADPDSSHARCAADRPRNPRWGLDYVITTTGPSWEIGTENSNVITQERRFLQALNGSVSTPSKG